MSKSNNNSNNKLPLSERVGVALVYSSKFFMMVSLIINFFLLSIIYNLFARGLVIKYFQYLEDNDIENFGTIFAEYLGLWGFVLAGVIGGIIYAFILPSKSNGKFRYNMNHFIVSLLISIGSSISWFVLIRLIKIVTILVLIVVAFFILASCS